MPTNRIVIAVIALLSMGRHTLEAGAPQAKEKTPQLQIAADLEARALKALATGEAKKLETVIEQIRSLNEAARRQLTLRVRPGFVQLRFRGEFPADRFSAAGLEYLISTRLKGHESLLVVDEAEMHRLRRLGESLRQLAQKEIRPTIAAQLVWRDRDAVHTEDLRDILRLEPRKQQRRFFQNLSVLPSGLGGTLNLQADPALLPAERTAAMMLISLRLPRPAGN